MAFFRRALRLTVVAVALLLVSCIDGREEVWLNEDGSGRADVCYTLPAAAARFQGGTEGVRRLLGEFLRTAPGLTWSRHEVVQEKDQLRIRVEAGFDSVREVTKSASQGSMSSLPSSAKGLAGEVKVKMDGRTIDFSRKISAGTALPGIAFIPGEPMKDRNLTYILHLPVAVSETNAMRVEDGGKTLVWTHPLAEAVKRPFETRFQVKVPVPGWLWGVVAGGLAAVLATGLFVVKRVRGKVAIS